jgi:hypothetical protein
VARQPLHFIAALTLLLGLGLGIAAVQIKQEPVVTTGASQSAGTTSTGTVSTPLGTGSPVSLGLPAPEVSNSAPGGVAPPVQLRLSKAAPGQSFPLPSDPTGAGPATADEVQSFLDGVNVAPGVGGSQGVPGLLNFAFNGGTPQVSALAATGDATAGGSGGGAGGGGATPPSGTTGGGGAPGSTVITPSTVTSPVPEPSTWALLTLGLGLLGWRRRSLAAPRRG